MTDVGCSNGDDGLPTDNGFGYDITQVHTEPSYHFNKHNCMTAWWHNCP